jgi:hypothetical protein
MYRCSVVVPDLLRMEFTIVSQVRFSPTPSLTTPPACLNTLIFYFGTRSSRLLLSLPLEYSIVSSVSSFTPFGRQPLIMYTDDDILMALPELYRKGREGKWFGTKLFLIYMFDGVVQVQPSLHVSFIDLD